MNLHEFQGKLILKEYGVPVPEGISAESPAQALEAARELQVQTGTDKWVIKAQVHAGGRGKGGGIKLANNLNEVIEYADQIIGMRLVTPQTSEKGKLVRKVLVQSDIYYPGKSEIQEFYVGILLNRFESCNMIMYSPQGGMDIEKVAEESPDKIFTELINPKVGLLPFQCRNIALNLGLKGNAFNSMLNFIDKLYKAYVGSDAKLIEINPVVKTSDNKIFAVDAKVVIDDNALFRHPDIAAMRDIYEKDPIEREANRYDLNYVKLDGNVGCMVNGAGLAMATMDIIKLSGGNPANFLDVGGSADANKVEKAFRIILKDTNVKAILVNIFGGIVRCDRVAQGLIDTYKSSDKINAPIIVRFQGTNAEEGKKLIDESGLKVYSAILLQDAADLITKVLK